MSRENVDVVRRAYEQYAATGEFTYDLVTPDFVWDMSNFHGWPEKQVYEGPDETAGFLESWESAWDDWTLEVEDLLDGGDKVVALMRQSGRSKEAGMPVEMSFAQVWSIRDGKESRMDMYSDRAEALEAAGLSRPA